MDRLELYYGAPSALQLHSDYIRIRNIYVRSTRSFHRLPSAGERGSARAYCREIDMSNKLRHAQGGDEAGGSARAPRARALRARARTRAPSASTDGTAPYGAAMVSVASLGGGGAADPASEPGGDLRGGGVADVHRGNAERERQRRRKRSEWYLWVRLGKRLVPWLMLLCVVCIFSCGLSIYACPNTAQGCLSTLCGALKAKPANGAYRRSA